MVISFFLPSASGANFSSDQGTTTFFSPMPATPPRPTTAWVTLPVLVSMRSWSISPISLPAVFLMCVPMMSLVSCTAALFFHADALVSLAGRSAGRVVCADTTSGAANSTAAKPASSFFIVDLLWRNGLREERATGMPASVGARLDETPAGFGERPCALATLSRIRIVGGAGDDTAHDPLRDGGETELGERDVKVPVLDAGPLRPAAIGGEVLRLGRNAELGQRRVAQPLPLVAQVIGHAVVREVGQRMPERRQLPVEHRGHARLGRMHDHVARPVIAVHERRLGARRNVFWQPLHESFHRLDLLGLRGTV